MMITVKSGGELLQIVRDGVLLFDCIAHMKMDPHGKEHSYEDDGVRVRITYSRIQATIEIEGGSDECSGSFRSGTYKSIGGIWMLQS